MIKSVVMANGQMVIPVELRRKIGNQKGNPRVF